MVVIHFLQQSHEFFLKQILLSYLYAFGAGKGKRRENFMHSLKHNFVHENCGDFISYDLKIMQVILYVKAQFASWR
jgi:hypothetical protein